MDNSVTINPKKAIEKYIAELGISYRAEDLRKALYSFIKQCGRAYEEVKLGKKNEDEVTAYFESIAVEILDEYFRNGNGGREEMRLFLDKAIEQKWRLYVQQSHNK